jgi:hypothetical protein
MTPTKPKDVTEVYHVDEFLGSRCGSKADIYFLNGKFQKVIFWGMGPSDDLSNFDRKNWAFLGLVAETIKKIEEEKGVGK